MSERRITAMCTAGESGFAFVLGSPLDSDPHGDRVTNITRISKRGQMADVEWFLVTLDSGTTYEVNGAVTEFVKEERVIDE